MTNSYYALTWQLNWSSDASLEARGHWLSNSPFSNENIWCDKYEQIRVLLVSGILNHHGILGIFHFTKSFCWRKISRTFKFFFVFYYKAVVYVTLIDFSKLLAHSEEPCSDWTCTLNIGWPSIHPEMFSCYRKEKPF